MLEGDERSPHVRGDGPKRRVFDRMGLVVVPTCVGMDRYMLVVKGLEARSPHVRGDGPLSSVPMFPMLW